MVAAPLGSAPAAFCSRSRLMVSLGRSVTLALSFTAGWDVATVVVFYDARPRVYNLVAGDLT